MANNISLSREQYLDALAQVSAQATDLTGRLNMRQFTWQPNGGERWSVAECLDHIAVSNDIYMDAMEPAASEASHGRNDGTFQTAGFPSTKFVRTLEPPIQRRLPAPRKILPRPTLNPEGILPNYLKTIDRVSRLVRSTSNKDLNVVRFRNPLLAVLRWTVGTGFLIVTVHANRHLWQAENVTQEPDFPR